MNNRLLSMFLALCMIVTMLPVSAMAEEIHTTIGGSGEIISFAPLTETEKTVSLGTSIDDLGLPETLTAMVRTAVSIGEDAVQDSGSAKTATPTTAAEPEWEETTGNIPVTWTSSDYDPTTEGVYAFTPVIAGYTVSAPLPEITVTIDEMTSAAPEMRSRADGATTEAGDYMALQNAINGATEDVTIQLSDTYNSVGSLTVNSSHNITIDLNGRTLTGDANYNAITKTNESSTLTITDSVGGGKIIAATGVGPAIRINSGNLVVAGGTVESTNSSGIAIANFGSGTVTVSGGTVKGKESAIFDDGHGSISVTGGMVEATSSTAGNAAIFSSGTTDVSVSGGTVKNTNQPAILKVNGDTAISGDALITSAASNGNLNPGTICIGGNVTLEITGGTIENTSVTGTAIFNKVVSGYTSHVSIPSGSSVIRGKSMAMNIAPELGEGVQVTASANYDGTPEISYMATDLATYKYIKIVPGATPPVLSEVADLTALQSAITGAAGDLDLKLSDSFSYSDTGTIAINCDYNITIDLNGKTLDGGSLPAIQHQGKGTLTIIDSKGGGIITGKTISGTIRVNNGGTVNINGGTVNATAGTNNIAMWVGFNSILNINGGTVSATGLAGSAIYTQNATLNISGGTVSATKNNGCAIYSEVGSSQLLNISGGTISATWTAGGIAISNQNTAIKTGKTIIIQGSTKAMAFAPTLDGSVQGGASTNIDGSGSVAYNVADLATYKYLKFGLDITPPVLSSGSVNRTSDTAATIGFTTDKAGTAYYFVVNSGASAPTSMAVKEGTSLGSVSGTVTGTYDALTAGSKESYVVVEDSADKISTPLKIEAAAYVAPPVLSAGNVQRANDTAATIGFTTDKAGTAYYLVVNSGATPPPAPMGVKVAGTSLGSVSGAVAGKAVTLMAGAKDIYVVVEDSANNISTPLKIPAAAYVPPVLSAGSVNRTSDTAATIGFTTDKMGIAYYLVVNSDASAPTNTEVAAGVFLGYVSGTVTGKAVALTAGAKDIYVIVFDTINISTPLKIEAAAYAKETPTTSDLVYSLTAVDYDGTAKPVSVTAAFGKDLGAITVLYDSGSGSTTSAPINAGTYTVTVNIAGNAEYNAVTGLSLGSYIINKVTYTGTTTVSASVLASGQTGTTVTLPDLPIGASYGTPTTDGVTMTDMSISDNTLTYTAPASTAGQTGTMTIPVTGATNYNDYNIVVTVTYTAKTPQVISYANATVAKTYGDTGFVNTLTQTTVDGAITYASNNTSVATVNATGEVTILAAGSATITATAAETITYAQATASYTVIVSKKALILKAEDKSMTKGDGLPSFTYTATGLVNGDTVTTPPTMSTATDGTAVGTFDITISGGVAANAASYDITYTKGTLTVAERLFIATVTNGTGSGSYAESVTVTITANDRSGYTFTGWSGADVTFANAAAKTTTFTMPAKAVTVTANYRQNSSGGDGGGSGGGSSSNDNSSPVIVTPPTPDKPNSPTQGEIKVSGTVDSKGNITVNITDKTVTDAFDKALADAKKNGNEQNGITVVLRVDTSSKTGSNVTVNLPKTVQDTIIAKKIVNTIVVVDNPDIRIGMDLTTVQEINKQAKSDVNITATRTDSGKLTGEAKKAIGSRPVFNLKVNYGSGKSVQSFGSGSVSVTIPYCLCGRQGQGTLAHELGL